MAIFLWPQESGTVVVYLNHVGGFHIVAMVAYNIDILPLPWRLGANTAVYSQEHGG